MHKNILWCWIIQYFVLVNLVYKNLSAFKIRDDYNSNAFVLSPLETFMKTGLRFSLKAMKQKLDKNLTENETIASDVQINKVKC